MAQQEFPLKKANVLIIAAGVVLLIIGNIILASEPFIDIKNYSNALYVAPWVLMAGFVTIAIGILYKPKS